MGKYHERHFPGESDAYRAARDALLQEEIALRQKVEAVAQMRRKLPLGGKLTQDYVFEEVDGKGSKATSMAQLFAANKPSLIIYSFMFPAEAETPCNMCNAIVDGLNGNAMHVQDRVNLAVVAKAPVDTLRDWAARRGWQHLRLLSSGGNSYNKDYFAESEKWGQLPAINVFRRTEDGIYHCYNSELLYAPSEPGQEPRHADMIWPLWNLFDLTPEGRARDWYPSFEYV